jgi:transcriptional regulator with XRE-family HTH domain
MKEVEICMLAQWTGEFVGRMHINGVTKTQLAQEMGVSREYVSMILNGHRNPDGIEQRMNDALSNLIEKQNSDSAICEVLNIQESQEGCDGQ